MCWSPWQRTLRRRRGRSSWWVGPTVGWDGGVSTGVGQAGGVGTVGWGGSRGGEVKLVGCVGGGLGGSCTLALVAGEGGEGGS